MSILNRLRSFPEWHDMDDRLQLSIDEGAERRIAFTGLQGKAFASFVGRQPGALQSSLIRIGNVLNQIEEPTRLGDDILPKMRTEIAPMRAFNDEIKMKRKLTQALRDRVPKTTAKCEALEAKLEAMRIRTPGSPDIARLAEELECAMSQKRGDIDTLDKREAQLATEERDYRKQIFLSVMTALEQFAEGRGRCAAALHKIGAQLVQVANELPFFDDPQADSLRAELETLRNEPFEQ
jgi:hypothetical protein